jgi:hypothetical protein
MVAVMIGSLMFRVLTEPSEGSGWMKKCMPLSKGAIITLALAIAAGSFWTMALFTSNVRCLRSSMNCHMGNIINRQPINAAAQMPSRSFPCF